MLLNNLYNALVTKLLLFYENKLCLISTAISFQNQNELEMDFSSSFEVDKIYWMIDLKWTKQSFQVQKNLKTLLPYFLSPSTPHSYPIECNIYYLLPSISEEIECISSFSKLNSDISSILITYMTLGKIFSFLNFQPSHL